MLKLDKAINRSNFGSRIPSRYAMFVALVVSGLLLSSCRKDEVITSTSSDTSAGTDMRLMPAQIAARIALQKKGELPIESAVRLTEPEYVKIANEFDSNQQKGPNIKLGDKSLEGGVITRAYTVQAIREARYVFVRIGKAIAPSMGKILSDLPKDRNTLNQWAFEKLNGLLSDTFFLETIKIPGFTEAIDCQEKASIYAMIWQIGNTYLENESPQGDKTTLQLVSGILHDANLRTTTTEAHLWVETMQAGKRTIIEPTITPAGRLTLITGSNNSHVAVGGMEITGALVTQKNGKKMPSIGGFSVSRRADFKP